MQSVRKGYETLGIVGFYTQYKDTYRNPKEDTVKKLIQYGEKHWKYGERVLDLCCGSGEVTLSLNTGHKVTGFDPFTYDLYTRRTKRKCIKGDFDDILKGKLSGLYFDTIICSFALHLCESSKLYIILWQLSLICGQLVIISPHKRPNCVGDSFELKDFYMLDKCTIKLYESKNFGILSEEVV